MALVVSLGTARGQAPVASPPPITQTPAPSLSPPPASPTQLPPGGILGEPPPARPKLPSLEASHPLPPLPERSPRNASYTIDARLDADKHTIEGSLVLEWRNTGTAAVSSFPFHLYWNAFRNNLSTLAREPSRGGIGGRARAMSERDYGYTHVRAIRLLLGAGETDLTPTLRFIQPDDGNPDDRTVMEVRTPMAVPPGATVHFKIDWTSRIPYGLVGRAGWVHDYFFVVQWFPKIGVLVGDNWNAHQFHQSSEFFADFGNYDVRLTLPEGLMVGATGRLQDKTANTDGTETLHLVQEDVHDFAWTASRRYLEARDRFDDPGYPPVEIRLLYQPEHAHLARRYLEATKIALRTYGAWSAPYPYPQVTVVDPAWSSASGGMEYPTLFTGGARVFSPRALQSPESVTIHEAGHQFWYGLVANNEFEEAWLDEGFNDYMEAKARSVTLGPAGWGRWYFGLTPTVRGRRTGVPVVAPGVFLGRGDDYVPNLSEHGRTDVMARRAWEYRTPEAYGTNAYQKPALVLQTLEALVGDETMTRILRTYARRFRFAHPTSQDFTAVVNEVTGRDYRWFFDETFFSSSLCDYSITVRNEKPRVRAGFAEGPDGAPVPASPPGDTSKAQPTGPYTSEVTVLRLGEVRMPVEVRVEFTDGHVASETWDGQYRWTRFKYERPAKVRRAIVDPFRRLAIDVNPANNSWVDEKGTSRRAAAKWAARWMFWLQDLLELHLLVG